MPCNCFISFSRRAAISQSLTCRITSLLKTTGFILFFCALVGTRFSGWGKWSVSRHGRKAQKWSHLWTTCLDNLKLKQIFTEGNFGQLYIESFLNFYWFEVPFLSVLLVWYLRKIVPYFFGHKKDQSMWPNPQTQHNNCVNSSVYYAWLLLKNCNLYNIYKRNIAIWLSNEKSPVIFFLHNHDWGFARWC